MPTPDKQPETNPAPEAAPDSVTPAPEAGAKPDVFDDDPVMREFAKDPALARDAERLAQSRRELLHAHFDEAEDGTRIKHPGSPRRRRRRPLWVAFLMAGVSVYFLFFIAGDVSYFLSSDDPVSLGEAPDFTGTPLDSDTYVTITGIRNPGRGVNLGGGLVNRNVFQLVGSKRVLVDTNAENEQKGQMLESRTFAGRLKRFADMPYYRAVRDFALEHYGVEFPTDAIVVRVGDKPADYWHMALCGVALVGILLFNLVQIGLWFKRRSRS